MHYATLEKTDNIATHILKFLICSIANPFKFSLANFATSDASASQMLPLLWNAISICELNPLEVLAVTYDRASLNRELFKIHFLMTNEDDMNPHVDVIYKNINLFSKGKPFIYFISDMPHLIKSA